MGQGRFFGFVAGVPLLALVTYLGWGCGASNDQGSSFRALGFFADGGDSTDNGVNASLTDDSQIPRDNNCDGVIDDADGGQLGLENNLFQGIRVERVDLSYEIPSSNLAIDPASFRMGLRLGPSSGQEPNSPSVAFRRVLLVSSRVFQFINNNRGQLGDDPFDLVVTARAIGVTDGGEVIESNPTSYSVTLFDGPVACPDQGEPTPEPTP
jgi:hypothetical protein